MITISSKDWSKQPTVEKTENIPEIILYWKHSTVSSALYTGTTKLPQRAVTMVFFHYQSPNRKFESLV